MMHHVTYSRKTITIKIFIILLFVIVILWVLFGDFVVKESSLSKGLIYFLMSIALLFFLIVGGMLTYYLCKSKKPVLLSFDENGFYYKDELIPYEKVKSFGYGLNRQDVRTMIFQGFTIETNKEDIIIPTHQLLLDREVNKWVFGPLEKYAPHIFGKDEYLNNEMK